MNNIVIDHTEIDEEELNKKITHHEDGTDDITILYFILWLQKDLENNLMKLHKNTIFKKSKLNLLKNKIFLKILTYVK